MCVNTGWVGEARVQGCDSGLCELGLRFLLDMVSALVSICLSVYFRSFVISVYIFDNTCLGMFLY